MASIVQQGENVLCAQSKASTPTAQTPTHLHSGPVLPRLQSAPPPGPRQPAASPSSLAVWALTPPAGLSQWSGSEQQWELLTRYQELPAARLLCIPAAAQCGTSCAQQQRFSSAGHIMAPARL